MPFYKDTENKVHFLDFDAFEHLLPAGSTKITDDEATDLQKPTTDQAKAAKWEAIKIERDHRTENGGYKVGTKWFHSDQKSRSQQLGLARKADRIETTGGDLDAVMHDSDGSQIVWKTMDGSFVPMTVRLAQQIAAAAETSDLATFKAAELHRAAMEGSADPASYEFSNGWPATFAG